jgi:hypothetical protein
MPASRFFESTISCSQRCAQKKDVDKKGYRAGEHKTICQGTGLIRVEAQVVESKDGLRRQAAALRPETRMIAVAVKKKAKKDEQTSRRPKRHDREKM